MEINLRDYLVQPRQDWNALGPKLPPWFKLRLKRLDPQLALQYMPPRSLDEPQGVDPCQYPDGVWAICRRLRGTGWLWKRWTWSLNDCFGRYQEPGMDTIDTLRIARDLWRRGHADFMEDQFAATLERFTQVKAKNSRARLRAKLERLVQQYDFGVGKGHVFIRESPLAPG